MMWGLKSKIFSTKTSTIVDVLFLKVQYSNQKNILNETWKLMNLGIAYT